MKFQTPVLKNYISVINLKIMEKTTMKNLSINNSQRKTERIIRTLLEM
jgi:hypothetical protein